MNFANPTLLRIGASGQLEDQHYEVVGRAVLGVKVDGETYYWHEYYLATADGALATLVYEVGETKDSWRLFTQFEPEYPMSAADAATKRVGDRLNLTGVEVQVTLVDKSRVYYLEGRAPEGVQLGVGARYFNAEAGDVMQVVSWTGDEVEFFYGTDLRPQEVLAGFQLPSLPQRRNPGSFSSLSGNFSGSLSDSNNNSWMTYLPYVVMAIIFLAIFGSKFSCAPSHHRSSIVTVRPAGTAPLKIGDQGDWAGRHYKITGHTVMEIAEVGTRWLRHEYQLTNDNGETARLVCGWHPGDKQWLLLAPLAPATPPTAIQCAARKVGDLAGVDDHLETVREIFLASQLSTDGESPVDWPADHPHYGFLAQSTAGFLLAEWDQATIHFQSGTTMPAATASKLFTH
jgi:hypothetical protein